MKIKGISQAMEKNLDDLGYKKLTPVQEMALPSILEGKDVIAQAKTGSGKTAAFGIGIIERISVKQHGVQALILCPTRELAEQVMKEIRRLARAKQNTKVLLLSGGHSFGYQLSSLRHGAHIVVGTPGRVMKHLKKGSMEIDALKMLVLDEADRMLDMGFIEDIEEIVSYAPASRQTLLFSATFEDEIKRISQDFQRDPVSVEAPSLHEQKVIEQHFYETQRHDKIDTTINILNHFNPSSAMIFSNTKQETDEIAYALQDRDIDARAIHGDMEQIDRSETLLQFANGSASVLVATDVAARGLDIADVACVINYDLPRNNDVYIHRIGRTGRAGKSGLAVSLFTSRDTYKVDELQEAQGTSLALEDGLSLRENPSFKMPGTNRTICIYGGRKEKLRAGDILGALTKDAGFEGRFIGKIDIGDKYSYIALDRSIADKAFKYLLGAKVKNKKFKVEMVE